MITKILKSGKLTLLTVYSIFMFIVSLIIMVAVESSSGSDDSPFQYISYPSLAQSEIDALGIDLGAPREHPGGDWRMTNKNGNLPFVQEDLDHLTEVDSVTIIGSDSIRSYLESNGWNEGDAP